MPNLSASTYNFIASQTLSNASTVTLSNIPQNYTDLKLVVFLSNVSASTSGDMKLTINGDANSNYSRRSLAGAGSGAISSNNANLTAPAYLTYDFHTPGQNGMSTFEFNFLNYTNTNMHKTTLFKAGNAISDVKAEVFLWRSYNPITSLTFDAIGQNFATGTVFSLYGIKAADTTVIIPTKAFGGDSIVTDGTYTYHVFKTTGVFTPATALTADVLEVAGGGGAAPVGPGPGGGGGGGVVYSSSQALTAGTSYTATVGAGGAVSAQGANSQFSSVTLTLTAAVGGGLGATSETNSAGGTGGSGGGGGSAGPASSYNGTFSGGSPISGQGNAGGYGGGVNGAGGWGGGGGGAGGAGGNSPQTSLQPGGAGGVGTNTYSSWANITSTGVGGYYAGGGAGGTNQNASVPSGGLGGGGKGGVQNGLGAAGVSSSGGGGGSGCPGGSGVIIVRYAN